ncbi:MAG: class II SORL domain-containing protein [Desulfovibrionales bacterium]
MAVMEKMKIGDLYKSDDWKTEKHVPVIESPEEVASDEMFDVKISIGKEVAHPNTTEHHIKWIKLYFMPEDGKFVHEVGTFEFSSHGADVDGPNQGPVSTHHAATCSLKIKKPGMLLATSYCNIHGLWENEKPIGLK